MDTHRIRLHAASLLFLAGCDSLPAEPPDEGEKTVEASAFSADQVEAGRRAYAMFCLACHGAEDAGVDSPSNLFDGTWHHGDSASAIERSIREGISEKGMPGWGQMISDQEINAVLAYLLSYQSKNFPDDQ